MEQISAKMTDNEGLAECSEFNVDFKSLICPLNIFAFSKKGLPCPKTWETYVHI